MMTGGFTPRRTGFFDGFDMTGFWSDFCDEDWNEPAPGDETIAEVETALGFRLPDAWVEFARMHNGGDVERNCFPTNQPTTWAEDHIAITSIRPIGRTAAASLLGSWGHRAVIEEAGYPELGPVLADCPSGGHDLVMLDHSECRPTGEPRVVHVDQEVGYRVTVLAPDFATFIKGLVSGEEFEPGEDV